MSFKLTIVTPPRSPLRSRVVDLNPGEWFRVKGNMAEVFIRTGYGALNAETGEYAPQQMTKHWEVVLLTNITVTAEEIA